MSTSDSNNDEFNNDDFSNLNTEGLIDEESPNNPEFSEGSPDNYSEGSPEGAYSDSVDNVNDSVDNVNDSVDNVNDSVDNVNDSVDNVNDSVENVDANLYDDSSEYPIDAYASDSPDVNQDGIQDGNQDENQENGSSIKVPDPPLMNRYNCILLLSLLILITGIVLVLIRLADYKFNVKAKQTDNGFTALERVVPMSDAETSVFKNV